MNHAEAVALLRPAIPAGAAGHWADLGAGTGTFTAALAALLPEDARITAVDADERALKAVRAWANGARGGPAVEVIAGDFARDLPLPPLDGVLIANALHFAPDAAAVLARVAAYLRRGGHLVLIEYQARAANPWVPYPLPPARFAQLAAAAGLAPPRVVATRPSAYGGELYVAATTRTE